MRFGSLFAGIGGFDLGLERAGMTCAWQVENDAYCNRVLAKHWPDVPRYGDIRTIRWDAVEPVDVLCGGFPCQPVSLAGKRLGEADERWLWPEFVRAIRELRPRYVLVENVPGLLVREFGTVLGDLAALGFDAEWTVLSASDVGAPHRRKRVWVVAYDSTMQRSSELGRQSDGVLSEILAYPSGSREWSESSFPRTGICALNGGSSMANSQVSGFKGGSLGSRQVQSWGSYPRNGISDQWIIEPDVGRVAHGVPSRVDRLRGLGNAIVPQCAEVIGRYVMALACG